jgi:hypothetical protein
MHFFFNSATETFTNLNSCAFAFKTNAIRNNVIINLLIFILLLVFWLELCIVISGHLFYKGNCYRILVEYTYK